MKLFERNGPGSIGLNYMWLPTWVGMNKALLKEIEEYVTPILMGQELTDETLTKADEAAIQFLVQKFPDISGLFEYLDGLKYVETNGEAANKVQEGRATTPSGV